MKPTDRPDKITAYLQGKLFYVLEKKKISQSQLATELNIDTTQLNRYLNHQHHTMSDNIIRIAQVLQDEFDQDIDLQQFIPLKKPKQPKP